jgi:hypothetical protein
MKHRILPVMSGRLLGLIAAVVLAGVSARAVTVDFTAANMGPAPTIQYGGVTITNGFSGGPLPSIPTMVAGVGLGSSTYGNPGTVDRVQSSSDGGYVTRESLRLSVSGVMTSLVLDAYCTIQGSNQNIFVTFDISIDPSTTDGSPGGRRYYFAQDAPMFINIIASGPVYAIDAGLIADFGNEYIREYIRTHPGTVFEFGYTIKSLTYTPTAQAGVPDGGNAVALFGGACGALFLFHRRRTRGQSLDR